MTPRLELTRAQVLAHRRVVGALDERLPAGRDSFLRAAWAGLQDSMPRAALLSLHARVQGTNPASWEDPAFVQVWGPRFSAYVVAARDHAVFSLGRLPDDGPRRRFAEAMADRLEASLDGRAMDYGEAGRAIGERPNMLRYAAATGRVLIRWDGARKPTVRVVPAPRLDPWEARLELARRHLHVFGPTTPHAFARWAGIRPAGAAAAWRVLTPDLTPVRTVAGAAWILSRDEASFGGGAGPTAAARLLPSGDAYFLLQGPDRDLLVPDRDQRRALWTPRVWPGAVVVGGEIVGTWRRADTSLSLQPWRRLSPAERAAVEAEAVALPLPGVQGRIAVRWG